MNTLSITSALQIVTENGTAYSQSYSGQYGLPGDGTDLGQLDMFLNSR